MMTTLRDLRISGPFDPETIFIERLKGKETLGAPFDYEVTVRGESPKVDLSQLIGELLTVTLEDQYGAERHFNGYVTQVGLVDSFDRHARYRLRLRPFVWLMSARVNCRIFQHKSVPDIVKGLFREHGFVDFDDTLADSYPSREYTVQYRESDFAFVSRLLEGAGISYFFKHQADRHTLVLADGESAYVRAPGYSEIPFHPSPADKSVWPHDHLDSWVMEQQLRSGAYASDDFDFQRPKAELLTKRISETTRKRDKLEIYDYPGGFVEREAGESIVRNRLQEARRDAETVTGRGNVRGLGAGNVFALIDHPLDGQNKTYLVVSASFDVAAHAYESGKGPPAAPAGSAGSAAADGPEEPMLFRLTFDAMEAKIPYRPARSTPVPRIEGPQTAIVVGQKGEEIWTDKYGRVKVQFHWDREGVFDENSSCWVRVAQVWAGTQWGAIHLPRIGQEVVVDFLEGDPDRPLVVGRVYNQDHMVPYELPGNKTQSGIKSRSTLGGSPANFNELRFEDKKGSEEVYLHAEKDLEILVENDENRSVGHDRTKEVIHDETTTVGGNRTESVTKNETIAIGGNRTEAVALNESVGITGSRAHTVEKNETVTVAGARSLSVGKNDSTTVGGSQSLDVAKNLGTTVGENASLSVGKDESITVGGKRLVDVGKALVIQAGDEIILKTGDASITLKKNGDITIKGKNITLDGSGKVAVKASGDVSIKGTKVGQN